MNDAETPAQPTTMPSDLQVSVRDFQNDTAAEILSRSLLAIVRRVGTVIDVSRLDGITVAINYDQALLDLDRGVSNMRPLSRSNTEEMQGVAMSPAVLRDGLVKTHIVINAQILLPLINIEREFTDEEFEFILGFVAHECAHVELNTERDMSFPDAKFGTPIGSYEKAVMLQTAEILWEEYAACRISAPFAYGQNYMHASTVLACTKVGRDQSNLAIKRYRLHGDVDRLIQESGQPLFAPIKAAAYLLGGMDAEALGWDHFAEVREILVSEDYDDLVDDLHRELRDLWNTRGSWPQTLAVYEGLESVVRSIFESGGLYFESDPDGACRVDVPFTPWTMPSG